MPDLSDKKVAILVDDNFEDVEFTSPMKALQEAGATVEVIGTDSTEIHGLNHVEPANTYTADKLIADATAGDYDALVLPGGTVNADGLRMHEKAQEWIKQFMDDSKPVAAICHAPWTLISAGVAKGKQLTSYETIQDDMKNAGAEWSDKELVVDGNLITSRKPDDLLAFNNAIIALLQPA